MPIWEVDFYRRSLHDTEGNPLWELVICDPSGELRYTAFCPQPHANVDWLMEQVRSLLASGLAKPEQIRVFRPQSLSLLETACQPFGIDVQPTRSVPTLKGFLEERSRQYPNLPGYTGQPYHPLALDKPPPVPLSEILWGEQWRFASLPAAEIMDAFTGRMIPILDMPEQLQPIKLGLSSTAVVPGVVIDGGRQAMRLARWLQDIQPVALTYSPGAPDGLILEARLVDRWIVATFEDAEVNAAGQEFEQRKVLSQGLHFLLVQPDDSGMTYSGFWLLKLNSEKPG